MNLVGSRGFWGFVLVAAGSLLMLQAPGVLRAGELAWSAAFGAAGLNFLCAFFRERDAYFGRRRRSWVDCCKSCALTAARAEAQAGRVGRTCRRRSS